METTLEEYLSEDVDKLLLQDHFQNWNQSKVNYPILFIRYEAIFDQLVIITNYLGLPEEFITNFPEKKDRKSTLSMTSEQNKVALDKLVGQYATALEALPNYWVRPASYSILPPRSRNYKNAYFQLLRSKAKKIFRRK